MIAALYVQRGGCYWDLPDVDPWDEARKATWLYARVPSPPALRWGRSEATIRLDDGFHSAEERRRAIKTGACQRMAKRERSATPIPFRDLLLGIARSVPQGFGGST